MRTQLRRIILFFIGDLSWKPPGWAGWLRRHWWRSAMVSLLLAGVSGSVWWHHQWEKRQPKPVRIKVTVVAPGVTPLAKEGLRPLPLVINFNTSVAKLEKLHGAKLQTQGIRIEPPVEGSWHWNDDRQLTFDPRKDWPAGQKYRIKLDRSLFPSHVLLERYEIETTTPAFVATMPKLEFYTDPTDPAVKQVTATLEFTHRVDPVELEKRLKLAVIGGAEIFKNDTPRFTLTAGEHQRVMYFRTSALTLPEREDFVRVTLEKGLPTLQGSAVTTAEVEKKVRVPDLFSFFTIKSVKGAIVRNNDGEPEQIVLIEGTCAAKSEDIQKALHVYLLPTRRVAKDSEDDDAKKLSFARFTFLRHVHRDLPVARWRSCPT